MSCFIKKMKKVLFCRIEANETDLQVDSDLKKQLLIPETRIVNVRSFNKLNMVQGNKNDIYVSQIINGKVGLFLIYSENQKTVE